MTKLAQTKLRILMALRHDYAIRDFIDSGTLQLLSQRFDLIFLTEKNISYDLSAYGAQLPCYELSGLRRRLYWLAAGFSHIHSKKGLEVRHRHLVERATFGVGPKISRLIQGCSTLGLAWPLGNLFRLLFRYSARNHIPKNLPIQAIFVYTSVRSYFCDDLVIEARRKKIPLLAHVNNWDNLNTKAFLEKPPYLGVWGEQGFLIARLSYKIPPYRIFVLGAPRFDIYTQTPVNRETALKQLNLSTNHRIILFCGAGVAFDELSLLEELDNAIADGKLPADLHILYKPHPHYFARVNNKKFSDFSFKHISLFTSGAQGLTKLAEYPALFAAAQAIISPFSTMVMEGAAHGLPALCVGYNDPGHANHDWGRAAFNLHIYIIRHANWSVICEQREDFLSSCQRLVKKMGDERVAIQAKGAAEFVWKMDEQTVADRITHALHTIAQGGHADNSLLHSVINVKRNYAQACLDNLK